MKLATPLGLLGLIAIAILILIYILKPKYEERKVSSTFIWKLSLRYKKQKIPFQWLKSSLVLILQVLALVSLIFMLTKPMIVLETKSAEKIIIIESSASMMVEKDGVTRFDRALSDITKIADNLKEEEKLTVILADEEAAYLARREVSATNIKFALTNATCSFGIANMDEALELAANVKSELTDSQVILYTSRNYEEAPDITIKNMSANEWNVAILDFKAELIGGYYVFSSDVASYNSDKKLSLSLYVDGKLKSTQLDINLVNNEKQTIVFDKATDKVSSYDYAYVTLNIEGDDFEYDNQSFLFGGNKRRFNVQLVSDNPRFLRVGLNVVGNCNITEIPVTPEPNEIVPEILYEGFDLYIFDGMTPLTLPRDGAVWLFNPEKNKEIPGLSLGTLRMGNEKSLGESTYLDSAINSSQSSETKKILDSINPGKLSVTKYTEIATSTGFDVLMTCEDKPVMATKNDNGVRIVVVGIDLSYSNLPLPPQFPVLMSNMYEYSLKSTLEQYVYSVGSEVEINSNPTTQSMNIAFGSEELTFSSFPVVVKADYPGVYKITQNLASTQTKEDNFFVKVAQQESDFTYVGEALRIPTVDNNSVLVEAQNDTIDLLVYIAAALLLLLFVEWGVQYREQY